MYILLRNNYLGNTFAEVITVITLFASAKPSATADCRGEFQGLVYVHILCIPLKLQNEYTGHVSISYCFLLNAV